MYTVFTGYLEELNSERVPLSSSDKFLEQVTIDLGEDCILSEIRTNGYSTLSDLSAAGDIVLITPLEINSLEDEQYNDENSQNNNNNINNNSQIFNPLKNRQKTNQNSQLPSRHQNYGSSSSSLSSNYDEKSSSEKRKKAKDTCSSQNIKVAGVARYINLSFISSASSSRRHSTRVYIEGHDIQKIPSPSSAVHFMNYSSYLLSNTSNTRRARIEADILAGLALFENNKFNQSREFIKRAQNRVLDVVTTSNNENQNLDTNIHQVYREASELQVLCLEIQRRQGASKSNNCEGFVDLVRLSHAAESGATPKQMFGERIPEIARQISFLDGVSLMAQLQPQLTRNIAYLLSHSLRMQVQIASANLLEHLVKVLDVQMGRSICDVLNGAFVALQTHDENMDSRYRESLSRLLDTCALVLPNMNNRIHSTLVQEVVSKSLHKNSSSSNLQGMLQTLRFLWIGVEKGECPIEDTELIRELLSLLIHSEETVRAASRKCWSAMKYIAPRHFAGNRLSLFVKWAGSCLKQLVDDIEELLSTDDLQPEQGIPTAIMLINLLDFITWVTEHVAKEEQSLMGSLLPLTTRLLLLIFKKETLNPQTNSLPVFDASWNMFETLCGSLNSEDSFEAESIIEQMLTQFEEILAGRSPCLRELHQLHTILRRIRPSEKACHIIERLLILQCNWIPYSVEDMTFFVTADMLRATRRTISHRTLDLLIESLLDPGTTRASIWEEMIEILVTILLKPKSFNANLFISVWHTSLQETEKFLDTFSFNTVPRNHLTNDRVEDRLGLLRRMLYRSDDWHYQNILSNDYIREQVRTLVRITTQYPRIEVRNLSMSIISLLFKGWINSVQNHNSKHSNDSPSTHSDIIWDICEWLGRILEEVVAPTDGWHATDKIQYTSLDLCEYVLSQVLSMESKNESSAPKFISLFHSRRLHIVFLLWDTLYFLLGSPVSNIPSQSLRLLLSAVQDTVHEVYRNVRRENYPSIFMNLRQLHMRAVECVERMLICAQEWILRLGGIHMLLITLKAGFPIPEIPIELWESIFSVGHLDGIKSIRQTSSSFLTEWCPNDILNFLESKYSLPGYHSHNLTTNTSSENLRQSFKLKSTFIKSDFQFDDVHEISQSDEFEDILKEKEAKTFDSDLPNRMEEWIEAIQNQEESQDELQLLSCQERNPIGTSPDPFGLNHDFRSSKNQFPVVENRKRNNSRSRPKSARKKSSSEPLNEQIPKSKKKRKRFHQRTQSLTQNVLNSFSEQISEQERNLNTWKELPLVNENDGDNDLYDNVSFLDDFLIDSSNQQNGTSSRSDDNKEDFKIFVNEELEGRENVKGFTNLGEEKIDFFDQNLNDKSTDNIENIDDLDFIEDTEPNRTRNYSIENAFIDDEDIQEEEDDDDDEEDRVKNNDIAFQKEEEEEENEEEDDEDDEDDWSLIPEQTIYIDDKTSIQKRKDQNTRYFDLDKVYHQDDEKEKQTDGFNDREENLSWLEHDYYSEEGLSSTESQLEGEELKLYRMLRQNKGLEEIAQEQDVTMDELIQRLENLEGKLASILHDDEVRTF